MRGKPRGYVKVHKNYNRIKKPKPVKRVSSKELISTKNKIKEVNRRLNEIDKKYNLNRWSSNNLLSTLGITKLDIVQNNRLTHVSKRFDNIALHAINKSLDKFLRSMTSTLKGVKQAISNMKKGIKTLLSDEDMEELDDEDIEDYFYIVSDPDFQTLKDYAGGSELIQLAYSTKVYDLSEEDFIDHLSGLFTIENDLDMLDCAKRLYDKINKADKVI